MHFSRACPALAEGLPGTGNLHQPAVVVIPDFSQPLYSIASNADPEYRQRMAPGGSAGTAGSITARGIRASAAAGIAV